MDKSRWKSSALKCKTYLVIECASLQTPQTRAAIMGATKKIFQKEIQRKLSNDVNKIINIQSPDLERKKVKHLIKETAQQISLREETVQPRSNNPNRPYNKH